MTEENVPLPLGVIACLLSGSFIGVVATGVLANRSEGDVLSALAAANPGLPYLAEQADMVNSMAGTEVAFGATITVMSLLVAGGAALAAGKSSVRTITAARRAGREERRLRLERLSRVRVRRDEVATSLSVLATTQPEAYLLHGTGASAARDALLALDSTPDSAPGSGDDVSEERLVLLEASLAELEQELAALEAALRPPAGTLAPAAVRASSSKGWLRLFTAKA